MLDELMLKSSQLDGSKPTVTHASFRFKFAGHINFDSVYFALAAISTSLSLGPEKWALS